MKCILFYILQIICNYFYLIQFISKKDASGVHLSLNSAIKLSNIKKYYISHSQILPKISYHLSYHLQFMPKKTYSGI